MPGKRVLILHGFEHERGPEHWLWWITQRLRDFDVPVQYPQLPNPFRPVLKDWVELAQAELELLGDGERIVITHSLGCVLWSLRLRPPKAAS